MDSNFIKYIEDSIKGNWELKSMTDYVTKKEYTYKQVGEEIARLHILFEQLNIKPQDKIALVGKNTPEWAITFLATITYGAVIVPILQDFNPNDIQHIINHSESKLLFLSDDKWDNLNEDVLPAIRGVFSITDFRCVYQAQGESIQMVIKHLDEEYKKRYSIGLKPEEVKFNSKNDKELAILNYTSGTTGFSKGVMLTGENMCCMIEYAYETDLVGKGYEILSFLPLAHAYGCAFDFVVQFVAGGHITFLTRLPSPKVLLKAMNEIKPDAIFTVPLVIEKIYKNNILPMLSKTSIKVATNIPFISDRIYSEIRNKLINVFGGKFRRIVIGGAPFNKEVEDFLAKIKFPYTVGYGMTECAPLISVDCKNFVTNSVGKPITGIDVRVESTQPDSIPGEIQVRGKNVMIGYYKNTDATNNVFTDDGWLKTGDMGIIDKEKNIFIKGRSKTMILTASGQNVYPEEIESKINNLPFVSESIVIQENDKIVALVYPDYSTMDEMNIEQSDLSAIMEEQRKLINNKLASYEQIKQFKIHPSEFEKTPKKSIKRYLYENKAI